MNYLSAEPPFRGERWKAPSSPRKLLNREEMAEAEQWTIEVFGLPQDVLMEVAGRSVAEVVLTSIVSTSTVLVVAGPGHNGADALVAARVLSGRGIKVDVLAPGGLTDVSEAFHRQRGRLERLGVNVRGGGIDAVHDALALGPDRVVDGLFGTGLNRPITEVYESTIRAIAASGVPVTAVDIPSGVDATSGQIFGCALPAEETVTFQVPKFGQAVFPGRKLTGRLIVRDIGIPNQAVARLGRLAVWLDGDVVRMAFAERDPETHKGTFGHVLVVGGQPDRPGALLLAGRGALRAGAGLVTVASDGETIRRLASAFGPLMGFSVGGTRVELNALKAGLEARDALAIGPSLPADDQTRVLVKRLLLETTKPVVLDAGALGALAGDFTWLSQRLGATVLTPHPGEMAALLGVDIAQIQADRPGFARSLAEKTGAVVVLKGAATLVVDPRGETAVVSSGNPGMATGGMGDVLTGMVGALLARGLPPERAAQAAAQLHGLAGDRARHGIGEAALTASDLLEHIGPAIQDSFREEPT
jgi:ADP-dependent NAD(P)H-hydrate dehydratase / NAD(P)H-hydrate epimerase